MAYSAALVALADPTRRGMFERLCDRPHTVGELATVARIRQPTVSQHLRVLRAAKLVSDRREGTRRYYRAERDGLRELRRYVESLWEGVSTAYAGGDPHPPAVKRRPVPAPSRRAR
jgi:DNA-binding transcriptional ArsR family regulator